MDYGGEKKNASSQEREMQICGSRSGENCTFWMHTAQRKQRKRCCTCENFVTEGSEKADEFAKAGAIWDEGFTAEARAETVQQEREEVYAALQYAASFLFGARMEGLWRAQAEAKRKVDICGPEKRGK